MRPSSKKDNSSQQLRRLSERKQRRKKKKRRRRKKMKPKKRKVMKKRRVKKRRRKRRRKKRSWRFQKSTKKISQPLQPQRSRFLSSSVEVGTWFSPRLVLVPPQSMSRRSRRAFSSQAISSTRLVKDLTGTRNVMKPRSRLTLPETHSKAESTPSDPG
jgi:hypothetical protein